MSKLELFAVCFVLLEEAGRARISLLVVMEQVLQTLVLIKTTVETLKNNQDRMRKLYTRCENLTARVIKKHGKYPNRAVTGPLQECLSNVSQLAQRFSKKNGFWHFVMVIRVRNAINRAYGDLDEALRDETLIILVDVEMRLAGVDGNVEELRKTLVRLLERVFLVTSGRPDNVEHIIEPGETPTPVKTRRNVLYCQMLIVYFYA